MQKNQAKVQEKSTYKIHIKGLVQGIGFRPFIYRIAVESGINGTVENTNNGIFIYLNATKNELRTFIERIRREAPIASKISSLELSNHQTFHYNSFTILQSQSFSSEITEICPDIAVCSNCLEDMKSQAHRINYPFINCTNCGPRFTIIQQIPYDRAKTTMNVFEMCHTCIQEYENVLDRRFHAQPIACNQCGPGYSLQYQNKIENDLPEIIRIVAEMVNSGKIIAIKGMGGFHLMCDAYNELAVKKLRNLKKRENKPFAVMCRNVETAENLSFLTEIDTVLLKSWQRPIVLVKSKNKLAFEVQNGLDTLGIMLPYMPMHYLVFEKLGTDTVVLTSGNFADEPITIDNKNAIDQFLPVCSAFLCYNREIYNRADDSVVQSINNQPCILRRSRGYAPGPVKISFIAEGVMAVGAELANVFAIGKQKSGILSQYIGDLKNIETLDFYEESYLRFSSLFRFKPKIIGCDLHPLYLSTKFAKELALKDNLELVEIQHHHAHIASVMAEYQLNEKIIGICMDGVGLGTDNTIWGAEFMLADYAGFERLFHFDDIKMAGGDAVSKEPWRSAISYLIATGNDNYIEEYTANIAKEQKQKINLYIQMLNNSINCFNYSSAGRLFDAVAGLCGICLEAGFHAEAPMRLESALNGSVSESYPYEKKTKRIDFSKMFSEIVTDIKNKVQTGTISAKFHNTIVSLINDIAKEIRVDTGINKVVLSGGTFQNKYLAEKSMIALINNGFDVFYPNQIPVNDGGIALGQLAIAAHKLNL